jgi:uncharacterized protein YggU (UPF0235/DUF167 family)
LAPGVGIEPTTNRLTGDCSTAELSRNVIEKGREFLMGNSLTFSLLKNADIIADMYIKVKVTAGAKKENIKRVSDDHYTISVKEKAEHNYANSRILEIFRNLYPGKPVRLISGHHSPSKIITIEI